MSVATITPKIQRAEESPILYPESDGNPIADNTIQYRYIAVLYGGLDAQFADDSAVFVAADNLWYPVEGRPNIRIAPDVYVVFGRPKGDRGSYRQWEEGGIAPQVVFEILSPGNRAGEMANKALFYDRYGVEEYYLFDPDRGDFAALVRSAETGRLETMDTSAGFTSPRLGVRFTLSEGELVVYHPNGERFKTFTELMAERDRIAQERDTITQERDQIVQERDAIAEELDQERARAARLLERLRELGISEEPS